MLSSVQQAVESVANGLPLFPRGLIWTASQFEFLDVFFDGRISGLDFLCSSVRSSSSIAAAYNLRHGTSSVKEAPPRVSSS